MSDLCIDNKINKTLSGIMSKSYILATVSHYGFIECGKIYNFLDYLCDEEVLSFNEARYVFSLTSECINKYATETNPTESERAYFLQLRKLNEELEFVLSIRNK